MRLVEGTQIKDEFLHFVRCELFVFRRLFAQVVEQVQVLLQFNIEKFSDIAQIFTLLDVIGNELYQRLSQIKINLRNLPQKFVVHKERRSFNYASY